MNTPRLYISFIMRMSDEQYAKYMALTPYRRKYIYSLWVKAYTDRQESA